MAAHSQNFIIKNWFGTAIVERRFARVMTHVGADLTDRQRYQLYIWELAAEFDK